MSLTAIPYPIVTLEQALAQLQNGKLLQQGWSPRCHPRPASGPDEWAVLKTTAIQPGAFNSNENKALPASLEPRPHIIARSGDLIMTNAGPRSRCGVPALIRQTQPQRMLSGKMYRFRANEQFDPEFLELWLLSPAAQTQIDRMKTGISDSGLNLTQSKFLQLPVPKPPLNEQRRIVESIDELLSQLNQANRDLVASKNKAHTLGSHLLIEDLNNTPFTELQLADLITNPVRNGRSVPTAQGGFPVLRLTALRHEIVDLQEHKNGAWDRSAARDYIIEEGDFLVSRGNGSLKLVGRGSLVPTPFLEVAYPDTMFRIRTSRDLIHPKFFAMVWNSQLVRRQIEHRARTTAGIYKINQGDLRSISIPVPNMKDQLRIIDRISAARETLDQCIDVADRVLIKSQTLRGAVLGAAFEGRLTERRPRSVIVAPDISTPEQLNLITEASLT